MFRTLLLLLIYTCALGRNFSGAIVSQMNQPIPMATIGVEGSTQFTYSDAHGQFSINVPDSAFYIIIQADGYALIRSQIQPNQNHLTFTPKPSVYQTNVVVIEKEEDFAKKLIRSVIQKNKFFRDNPEQFSCGAYLKNTFEDHTVDTNKQQLNLVESALLIYHKSPNQWKEIKQGIRDYSIKKVAGNTSLSIGGPINRPSRRIQVNPNLFFTSISDGNFQFYTSVISIPKISETPIISPVGPLAFTAYNFLVDTFFVEKGDIIYKIQVRPKNQNSPLFSGHLYINENHSSIQALELQLPNLALNTFNSFKIYQHYSLLDSIPLLDKQQIVYAVLKMNQRFIGTSTAVFHNYDLTPEFSKNTFNNAVSETEDSAMVRSDQFWDSLRLEPLKKREQDFAINMEKLKAYYESDTYKAEQDSINNRIRLLDIIFTGIDFNNSKSGMVYIFDPLIKQVKPFGVGGYRHSIGGNFLKTTQNKHIWHWDGQVDYGFNNNDLRGSLILRHTYLPKKFAAFKIGGGSKYQLLTFFVPIADLFSRGNYVQNNFLEIGHFHEVFNGLFLNIHGQFMERKSISQLNLAGWSNDLFGNNNIPLDFEDYNELRLNIELEYTPFQKYKMEPYQKIILGSKFPTFILNWEQGIPGLFNAKIHYQKLSLGLRRRYKLSLLGNGVVHTMASKYLFASNVAYPNFTFFRGTDQHLLSHPTYTYQMLGETFVSLNQYIEARFIHHFNGAIMNKIPIAKKLHLETVAGGGILLIEDNNFNHSEIFFGLDKPFKVWGTKFRLGGYYCLAYSNYNNGASMFKFGINIFDPISSKWAY